MMDSLAAIVLGAGKGTRMKSTTPKVLHKILGKSMIQRVIETLNSIDIHKICVVLSKDVAPFQDFIDTNKKELVVTLQHQQLGTADAVASAGCGFLDTITAPYNKSDLFKGSPLEADKVIICYGDTPLLKRDILSEFVKEFTQSQENLMVLGIENKSPKGYGRLILDKDNNLDSIVEEKDASKEIKKVTLCNSGIIIAKKDFLFSLLSKVDNHNSQKEYYLTDIVKLSKKEKVSPKVFVSKDSASFEGVNDKIQLATLEKLLVEETIRYHHQNGITVSLPQSTYIEDEVQIGKDSVIEPFVTLKGKTIIGKNCLIRSGSYLENAEIPDNSTTKPNETIIIEN